MPNPLTDARLRELLAVAEKATPYMDSAGSYRDWWQANWRPFFETFQPPAVRSLLTELLTLREWRRRAEEEARPIESYLRCQPAHFGDDHVLLNHRRDTVVAIDSELTVGNLRTLAALVRTEPERTDGRR
jgi:hypothetical protein